MVANLMSGDIEMNKDGFPESAKKCQRCELLAVIRLDGLNHCLHCGATASLEKGPK